jgi:prepilin-type N-terminal cleavage/methylation domain-containing protein
MLRRRGFTLLETLAAAAVLGGLMVVCVKFFAASAAQQAAMRDRGRAAQLAANVMERLAATPWDLLTAENVRRLQDAEDLRQGMPDGKIEIRISQTPGEPDAKQIAVVVHCPSPPDVPQRPVRLAAWRYRLP